MTLTLGFIKRPSDIERDLDIHDCEFCAEIQEDEGHVDHLDRVRVTRPAPPLTLCRGEAGGGGAGGLSEQGGQHAATRPTHAHLADTQLHGFREHFLFF